MVDPYVDATTGVPRNRLGIADATESARVEALVAAAAELTLYREARAGGRHDLDQLRAVHRRLFGEIYDWAGELRTVDIAKGQTLFALAVHVDSEGRRIFVEGMIG